MFNCYGEMKILAYLELDSNANCIPDIVQPLINSINTSVYDPAHGAATYALTIGDFGIKIAFSQVS
jgi:hypothetical protein